MHRMLQVSFCKSATYLGAFLRKMTHEIFTSYGSSPACSMLPQVVSSECKRILCDDVVLLMLCCCSVLQCVVFM